MAELSPLNVVIILPYALLVLELANHEAPPKWVCLSLRVGLNGKPKGAHLLLGSPNKHTHVVVLIFGVGLKGNNERTQVLRDPQVEPFKTEEVSFSGLKTDGFHWFGSCASGISQGVDRTPFNVPHLPTGPSFWFVSRGNCGIRHDFSRSGTVVEPQSSGAATAGPGGRDASALRRAAGAAGEPTMP